MGGLALSLKGNSVKEEIDRFLLHIAKCLGRRRAEV